MTRVEHPQWCVADHSCNLGEHRARPVAFTRERARVVLTRVRAADGREHVEIRTRIVLATGEAAARAHLAQILTQLDALLRHLTRRPR